MQVVGTSAKRVDGPDKVSGAAAYTGEVHLPGMAYAKLVPSPLPHATIKRIDASRARALAGVYAVLTGAELVGMEQTYGSERKDRPIVAVGKVRFQGEAVAAVAKAVRRSSAGLKNPQRPIGVFMFLGPTGVGKTYLAEMLGEFMFGSKDNIVRIDMSEFMEKHTISRLVGSPPG